MAFKQGIEMFSQIIEVLKCEVEDTDVRVTIYEKLVDVWKEYGCDDLHACLHEDPVFDKLFEGEELHEDNYYDDSWGGDSL